MADSYQNSEKVYDQPLEDRDGATTNEKVLIKQASAEVSPRTEESLDDGPTPKVSASTIMAVFVRVSPSPVLP